MHTGTMEPVQVLEIGYSCRPTGTRYKNSEYDTPVPGTCTREPRTHEHMIYQSATGCHCHKRFGVIVLSILAQFPRLLIIHKIFIL